MEKSDIQAHNPADWVGKFVHYGEGERSFIGKGAVYDSELDRYLVVAATNNNSQQRIFFIKGNTLRKLKIEQV